MIETLKTNETGIVPELSPVVENTVKDNPYFPLEKIEAAVKSVEAASVKPVGEAPVLTVHEELQEIYNKAKENNQEDIMAKISVAYQAIEVLTADLQRLTNHVNRELGVAQDMPLHERFARLEQVCLKNFLKIKEATRLLN
jgi:U3 small nucleolar ribonucleoprotein component